MASRFLVWDVERGGIPQYRPEVKAFDDQIAEMRCQGVSLLEIVRVIGKPHPYALHRLVRIGRREAWDEHGRPVNRSPLPLVSSLARRREDIWRARVHSLFLSWGSKPKHAEFLEAF